MSVGERPIKYTFFEMTSFLKYLIIGAWKTAPMHHDKDYRWHCLVGLCSVDRRRTMNRDKVMIG